MNKKRIINTFIEIAKIDSVSGEEQDLAKYLVNALNNLGGRASLDSYGNVIGKFEGVGESYMINAHMDTVEPGRGIQPKVTADRIVSDGNTIVGGDCKAGITIILEALSQLKDSKKAHVPIEVVFTREEETGLDGANNLDYSKITSKKGITFDGESRVSNITVASPSYNDVNIVITGRASHAGSEPEKGISAIKIAAEIISKLKLGRIDYETTANIGLITGGSARNAVPEIVKIQGEIRSRSLKKLEKHTEHFKKVFEYAKKSNPEAKIVYEFYRQFNAYRFNQNHPVLTKILSILKRLKMKPKLKESGGGTDVNIFNNHGIEAICVGIGDYNAHTTREYVKISEMEEGAKFLFEFLTTTD